MSASQLIAIGQAILLYSNENEGNLPPSLKEICVTQDISSEVFVGPASADERATGHDIQQIGEQLLAGGHCSYQYVGAGQTSSLPADAVLAVEKPNNHGRDFGMNVLFGDGHVRHITGAASKQILDLISRAERPVRYSGSEGQLIRKSG